MGTKPLRVYLSSTFEDLKDYRAAVSIALEKAGLTVARMEGYTAADERPLDLCLRDVAQADIYIGLFAWRYGYVPPQEHGNPLGKSITELEYRQAEDRKVRKLLFFAHSDAKATWPEKYKDTGDQGRRLEQLRKDLGTEKAAAFFHTPDDLATQVLAAIMRSGLSGRPYNVPPPPSKFVPRPDLTKALIDSLINPGANTVVQGAGGFGKTSLALDACRHPEVINAFPNGILWAALGQKPDIRQMLEKFCLRVTGEQPTTADTAVLRDTLAQALGGRDYLIVIDDPWRAEDLLEFIPLEGARLLVCTRIRNLVEQASEASWPEVLIDEMTSEQASALLMQGFPVSASIPAAVQRLADELGCWPLLLDLANARLLEERRGGRGDLVECAEFVTDLFHSRGVRVLDRRDSKTRNAAAAISVATSLEFIEESYPGVARKAAEIGIFPEDTAIPISTLMSLWKADRSEVEEEVLRPLDNLGIVQWNRRSGAVWVHDVVRLVLANRLREPADVHAALIDAWGDLRRLPDSYAWRWIAYHLLQAKRIPQLREMLFDFEWMQAKLKDLGVASLIADYDTLPGDRELRLVQQAVQLSADVIVADPSQFAAQLHGRLLGQDESGIKDLLASAVSARGAPWFRPLSASLSRAGGPLIRTLRGHSSHVLDAAITSDGRRVVSASADNTLIVWDLERGEAERVLIGHTAFVISVAVTPDGTRVISGSLDDTVRVWDLEDGRELHVLRGHTGPIEALVVTPDSTRVVSASADATLKVWDLVTGVLCHTLIGHSGRVNDIQLTRDGRYAVSASEDCTLSVWDLEKGTERHTLGTRNWYIGKKVAMPDGTTATYWSENGVLTLSNDDTQRTIQRLPGHVDRVDSVALTPDGSRAVSASCDGTLRVWDVASGAELRILRGHSRQVGIVKITSDGRRAISGSLDKSVRVWDLETGELLATLEGHTFDVFFVAEIHGGKRVLSASLDSTLKVWDIETGRELSTLRAHTQSVRALVVLPDGRRAISASNDATLRVWDLELAADQQSSHGHISHVNAIAVTADGRLAVTVAGAQVGLEARDHTVKVWEIEKGIELFSLAGHGDYVWTIATTPDGRSAVSGAADNDLKVWDLEAGIELATLRGHSRAVWDVQITPDGRTAVSSSSDHTLSVWNLECATRQHTLTGHTAAVYKVTICPAGRIGVSTSEDQTVRVWDLEAGTELRTFHGHTATTMPVVITPDGSRVISGDGAGIVRVWSLETGDELSILSGHSGPVTDLTVSPDGCLAVSASGFNDCTLRVWELATGELLQILRGHTAYINRVAMIENARAVSISVDGTARLWNLMTGAMLAIFTGESDLRSMAVTTNGTIVVGEQSGRVHFLRIQE